jgi:hypothetical protein
MKNNKYLTKSRFKLALECPTKLYYTGKREYPDKKIDDTFLEALAKGGFQVGELAKCYFPNGHNIDELDYNTALSKTNELLKKENAVIYEAAFQYKNLFIRADIVVKCGNCLSVYEVKAKSINSAEDEITNKSGGIDSKWKPYVYDIAFQKYVVQSAFPELKIKAFLMLADKNKSATVDGLNQKFFLYTDDQGRNKVKIIGEIGKNELGENILVDLNVDEIIDQIFAEDSFTDIPGKSFKEWIHFYADVYEKDEMIIDKLGSKCAKCEFTATKEEESTGKSNGYKECWQRLAKFADDDFDKPHINEIWDFRKKDKYIASGKYFQSDLSRADLESAKPGPTKAGLSRVDRQELQIIKSSKNDETSYFEKEGIKRELNEWVYPYHFIDFETTAVGIPFNLGMRPYEQIAFQFSHHIVLENGKIEHKGQWINTEPGNFPNFEFLRVLKSELDKDEGTILRYAPYENSILNAIYRQLMNSNESDKDELLDWIKTITHSTGSSAEKWKGKRDMVDMWDLVKRFFYYPETKGSNSIKHILPATINSSDFLKTKYSQPLYGKEIVSLNYKDHTWITFDNTVKIVSPYKKLTPIFENIENEMLDNFLIDEEVGIQDGGAAMMAYAQMQFAQMSKEERTLVQNGLLRYCELDTFAMVMLWEEWNQLIKC